VPQSQHLKLKQQNRLLLPVNKQQHLPKNLLPLELTGQLNKLLQGRRQKQLLLPVKNQPLGSLL
jgi:hypothetical protein